VLAWFFISLEIGQRLYVEGRRKEYAYLAVDELDVVGALSITVTSSILGTSFVGRETGLATILFHLYQIESAIESTRQVRNVNIESELPVEQLEHLVLVLAARGHQIVAGANVSGVGTLGHKLERKSVATSSDTVCTGVVSTVKSTGSCAGRSVRADGGVPFVASVAVSATGRSVQPAPVGVQSDRGRE
jgi:hypothetical protein